MPNPKRVVSKRLVSQRPFAQKNLKISKIKKVGTHQNRFEIKQVYMLRNRYFLYEKVFFNKNELKSWYDFKNLNKEMHALCATEHKLINIGKKTLELEHPFVHVVGKHAVDAFNKLCQKHVKSGNLHHYEVMDCKYQKYSDRYCFYMTIEAIDNEGNFGVYEAAVGCFTEDCSTSLAMFILTDRRPTGEKAMKLRNSIHPYNIMKSAKKDMLIKLKSMKENEGGVTLYPKKENEVGVATEFVRLEEQHTALKGICKILPHQIWSEIPKNFIRRSSGPVPDYFRSGLKKRNTKASCKGYDFYNHEEDLSFLVWML